MTGLTEKLTLFHALSVRGGFIMEEKIEDIEKHDSNAKHTFFIAKEKCMWFDHDRAVVLRAALEHMKNVWDWYGVQYDGIIDQLIDEAKLLP
jgi:hypothetical protein